MYADDTNLFLTHKDISCLFKKANLQLERINQWFISNKPVLKESKKRTHFSTNRAKETIFRSFYEI